MKRAGYVAAVLMLLFTLTSTQTPPTPQATPSQIGQHPSEVDDLPRRTPVTRSARPAVPQTVTVQPGDTYSRWATTHCGTFNMWPGIQAANRWPETAIPVGATASIVCIAPAGNSSVAPPNPAPAVKPATASTSPAWVHPLASGRNGNSCYRTSSRPGHNGVDMAQPAGTPIRAAAAGTIYRKAYQAGGAGYYVVIRHAGNVYTAYMHLRVPSLLNVGAAVSAGQIIGYVGATGNATGNHLHFEVHQGYEHHVNPAAFMRAHGVNIGC